MHSFNKALFHRAPGGAKTATYPDECGIFQHESVFELGTPVTKDEVWKFARAQNAFGKHAASFSCVAFR